MSRRLQLALGGLFFALFFIYAGASVYRTVKMEGAASVIGWRAEDRTGRVTVVNVLSDGPGSQLGTGDEVISVNGVPISKSSEITDLLKDVEPGSVYAVVIRRGGRIAEVLLRTEPFPVVWFTLLRAANVIIPALFLITGLVVFVLKPFDKHARLLALMFALFVGALFAGPVTSVSDESPWIIAVAMIVRLISIFFAAVFFHFFLVFPEPSPILKRFPRLEYYLYLPHLLTTFTYSLVADILLLFNPGLASGFTREFGPVIQAGLVLSFLYIAAGLASLLVNYRQASLAARRKMRVVVSGSIAGFLPPLLLVGVSFLLYLFGLNLSRVSQEPVQWLVLGVFFSFSLFPLSFAYAIVRHQVIPVRVIIRRGVRYLLVSKGFIIVEAVVVLGLLSFLLSGARVTAIDRAGSRADIAVTGAAALLAVFLLRTLNRQVMPRIDRLFFREAYNAQQILSDLGQAVRTAATIKQLVELVVGKIQDALHTENVLVFLRDDETGDYRCAVCPQTGDEQILLSGDSILVEHLRNPALAIDNPRSMDGLSRSECEVLADIRSVLLLPIRAKDQLLGIISLGPRLAELPFSREDRQMLMAVAWQTAFAIENAKLIREVADEERLRHEIEIAAQVQRRLFPQSPPQIPHLDLFGMCIPAQGVGGDYFDFIELSGHQTGLAVADVAGKGISAALLMSIVQASLRSKAGSVNGRLTDLVSSMNELLHRSTGPHSYASFFYAEYDHQAGHLTYVNAGHNPPILVRASAASATAQGFVERERDNMELLSSGGTVIGAFSHISYRQETIDLRSGDLLVAYTDGLTEALDPKGVEYGEANLLSVLRSAGHLSASELSDCIVASVQEWCRETPQHDDMTLVIMKVR